MKKILFTLMICGLFSSLSAEVIASKRVIDGLCNLYSEQARARYHGDNSATRSYKERIKSYRDRFGLHDFDSSECDIYVGYGPRGYDCTRYGGCGAYGRYYNPQDPNDPWRPFWDIGPTPQDPWR